LNKLKFAIEENKVIIEWKKEKEPLLCIISLITIA